MHCKKLKTAQCVNEAIFHYFNDLFSDLKRNWL